MGSSRCGGRDRPCLEGHHRFTSVQQQVYRQTQGPLRPEGQPHWEGARKVVGEVFRPILHQEEGLSWQKESHMQRGTNQRPGAYDE